MPFSIVIVIVVVIALTGRVDYDKDNGQERSRSFYPAALGQDIEQLATGHQG